jgi:hypothetical protein
LLLLADNTGKPSTNMKRACVPLLIPSREALNASPALLHQGPDGASGFAIK